MATPLIIPAGLQGKEPRNGTAIGRVELLDDRGEVERGWDLGLGRWTLGSSRECSIAILGGPDFESLRLELTVGKRYTLLKASEPVSIGGRNVREWLIDRSILVECGSRRLMIHPHKDRPSGVAGVSVVGEERIPEVASRLGLPKQNVSNPPAPVRGSDPAHSTDRDAPDLKRGLEELRVSVEAIQRSLATVSDFDAWDQRIEKVANQSISAIEAELGERIRSPLQDELREFLSAEQSRWQEPMVDRIESLEKKVIPRIERWEESLRSTQQGIVEIHQQISELTDAIAELVSSRETDSAEQASEVDRSDSQQHDQDDKDQDSDGYAESSAPDSWPSEDSASDAEGAFEFQVDDESISLRLNRILGDKVESRLGSHDPSPDGRDGDVPDLDRSNGNPDSEPEPASFFAAGVSEVVNGHTEQAMAADQRRDADNPASIGDSETSSPEEDSIEEYMQRLLNRVRSGKGSEPGPSGSKDSPKTVTPNLPTGAKDDGLSSASLSGMIRATSRRTTALRPPTQPVAEAKSDLQAFRELANSNARRAINRSEVRRQGSNSIVKSAIMVIAVLTGCIFFFTDVGNETTRLIGFLVSMIIAGVWGIDALREWFSMRIHRKQAKAQEVDETEQKTKKKLDKQHNKKPKGKG